MRVIVVFALALASVTVISCGGGSVPSNQAGPSPATPTNRIVTGRVVSDPSGQTIQGATIEPTGYGPVASSNDGMFSIDIGSSFSARVTGKAAGHLDHQNVAISSAEMTKVGLISLAPPFNLETYRQIVRNTLEGSSNPQTLRRQTSQPTFYLNPLLEDGTEIPEREVAHVVEIIQRAFPEATDGVFNAQLLNIVREFPAQTVGRSVRVSFSTNLRSNGEPVCGMAGSSAMFLQYGERSGGDPPGVGSCVCNKAWKVEEANVIHEIGHVAGLFHHSSVGVMNIIQRSCDVQLTQRGFSEEEKLYVKIQYSRPVGNRDPDVDPQTTSLTTFLTWGMQP